MRLFKLYMLLLLGFLSLSQLKAEVNVSDSVEVSLLTVAPGAELYSCFGHSGIRFRDTLSGMDIVFNYGTFDFDKPGFYTNFVRGKLWYMISAEPFSYFKELYSYENRRVTELVLSLNAREKQKLFSFLLWNYKPENREYRYDFFLDNCASRIRDVFEKQLDDKPIWDEQSFQSGLSFRQLIDPYIHDRKWIDLGIDLILGSPSDRKALPREYVFLPDHLETCFKNARRADGQSLVAESRIILDLPRPVYNDFEPGPVAVLWVICILICLISIYEYIKKKSIPLVSTITFIPFGILGVFYLFMWFGTDHHFCGMNYNLLWASPFLLMLIPTYRSRGGLRFHFYITLLHILLLLICLAFGAMMLQPFHPAVLPLQLVILFRLISGFLYRPARESHIV